MIREDQKTKPGGTVSEVYLVTSGSYSAYRIVAIYAERSLAEKHVEITNRDGSAAKRYDDAAEIEVHALLTDEPLGFPTYIVDWQLDTIGRFVVEHSHVSWDVQSEPTQLSIHSYPTTVPAPGHRLWGQATDEIRLRKAIQDRASQIQAEIAGL